MTRDAYKRALGGDCLWKWGFDVLKYDEEQSGRELKWEWRVSDGSSRPAIGTDDPITLNVSF